MTRTRSFQTAAARRRNDPLVWEIDGTTIHLRATFELADIAPMLEPLVNRGGETMTIADAASKRKVLIDCVAEFVDPADRAAFVGLAPDIDTQMLGDMLQELVEEYAGVNPTQRGESSAGSQPTGSSS